MATTGENVIEQMAQAPPTEEKVNEINKKPASGVNHENGMKPTSEKVHEEKEADGKEEAEGEATKDEAKTNEKEAECEAPKEEMTVEVEPKTGVPFPVELDDGKQLLSIGLTKESMLGIDIKIYCFGMYADNEKLKDLLKSTIGKAPAKPTKEMYQAVIDSEVTMMVRLIVVFSNLKMSMVKKNFDEGLRESIKKLTGGKKEELANKVMGQASDDIKLTPGSVIVISRHPGFVLQTKVKDDVVSTVESEHLCRAYIHMYLGDDPLDKEAIENFGMLLLSLF